MMSDKMKITDQMKSPMNNTIMVNRPSIFKPRLSEMAQTKLQIAETMADK
jgi:hypothetical protein